LGFQHRRDHEPAAGDATGHFVARNADAARMGNAVVCQDRIRRRRRWPGVPEKSASYDNTAWQAADHRNRHMAGEMEG